MNERTRIALLESKEDDLKELGGKLFAHVNNYPADSSIESHEKWVKTNDKLLALHRQLSTDIMNLQTEK